jgi:hypothetical protein
VAKNKQKDSKTNSDDNTIDTEEGTDKSYIRKSKDSEYNAKEDNTLKERPVEPTNNDIITNKKVNEHMSKEGDGSGEAIIKTKNVTHIGQDENVKQIKNKENRMAEFIAMSQKLFRVQEESEFEGNPKELDDWTVKKCKITMHDQCVSHARLLKDIFKALDLDLSVWPTVHIDVQKAPNYIRDQKDTEKAYVLANLPGKVLSQMHTTIVKMKYINATIKEDSTFIEFEDYRVSFNFDITSLMEYKCSCHKKLFN